MAVFAVMIFVPAPGVPEPSAARSSRKAYVFPEAPFLNSKLIWCQLVSTSIRRAAERKAKKLALKGEKLQPQSSARLEANRANALLSTGPASEEGKRRSSLNAVKTALTGVTVLLPTDDAAEYQRHIAAYEKEFQPVGIEESELTQSLADISWRLRRIPTLEMAIYAQGGIEFADLFDDQDDAGVRRNLIELHTHLVYEKQLHNLQLQEARLVRRREKETAEFRRLQQERRQREMRDMDCAVKLYLAAKQQDKPFDPAENGFEFSIGRLESYLERVSAAGAASRQLSKEVSPAKMASRAA
jgi:hypothetical protein